MTAFGHAMRSAFCLDPEVLYLNHGTVGATPRRVMAAQQALRDRIETQPARYMLREVVRHMAGRDEPTWMRAAARDVAAFVNARPDDVVFVDNATTGANAVLRSLCMEAGDEILITDLCYGAVANAAEHAARQHGATVRTVCLPYPPSEESFIDTIDGAIGGRTRLAIVDHCSSESALVFPLAAIAARCRAKGVAVLGDGAHAPGMLELDLPALGVDFYAANLHKWAWAPRSSGFLWARADRQQELHPPVISWGLDQGFTAEFDWVGTRDPTPWLAAPEGIAFLRELGLGEVLRHNHDLAWRAARELARAWSTELPVPETMVGAMATVPLPAGAGTTRADGARLRNGLLDEDAIEIQIHPWRDRLWARLSAQVYNELADYERLADAVLCRIRTG